MTKKTLAETSRADAGLTQGTDQAMAYVSGFEMGFEKAIDLVAESFGYAYTTEGNTHKVVDTEIGTAMCNRLSSFQAQGRE